MRREWVLGLTVLALGVAGLLIWGWIDAGVEPVRALTAPAIVPGVSQ